jgi:hypothetical protein
VGIFIPSLLKIEKLRLRGVYDLHKVMQLTNDASCFSHIKLKIFSLEKILSKGTSANPSLCIYS